MEQLSQNKLNELLGKASRQQPVMDMQEVRSVLASGTYVSQSVKPRLNFGLNTLLYAVLITSVSLASYIWYLEHKGNGYATTVKSSSLYEEFASLNKDVAEPKTAALILPDNFGTVVTSPSTPVEIKAKPKPVVASKNNSNVVAMAADHSNSSKRIETEDFKVLFNKNNERVIIKFRETSLQEVNVDGKAISQDEYSAYNDLIIQALEMARKKQSNKDANMSVEEKEYNKRNAALIETIETELFTDALVTDTNHYEFMMSNNKLFINGKVQSDDMFRKYKLLYEEKIGTSFASNAIYKFKRGK